MVGGHDYGTRPFNLATQGHRQPGSSFKPFTLVTALSQGHSPDEVFSSQPKSFPFTIKAPTSTGRLPGPVPDVFDVHNYERLLPRLRQIATATTYSDNSVYAELGIDVGVAERRRDGAEDGDRDRPLDRDRVQGRRRRLESLQPRPDPRWPRDRRHPARDGARLRDAGRRTASGSSGTMAASPDGPVAIEKVHDSDGDPVPTNDGESGENKVETKQVIDPAVARSAKSILHTVVSSGTGTQRAHRRADVGQDRHHRQQRRRLVRGRHPRRHGRRVGRPRRLRKPMETEYSAAPPSTAAPSRRRSSPASSTPTRASPTPARPPRRPPTGHRTSQAATSRPPSRRRPRPPPPNPRRPRPPRSRGGRGPAAAGAERADRRAAADPAPPVAAGSRG